MSTRYLRRAREIEALTFTYTPFRGWVVAAETRAARHRLARLSAVSRWMPRTLTALVVALVHLAALKLILATG